MSGIVQIEARDLIRKFKKELNLHLTIQRDACQNQLIYQVKSCKGKLVRLPFLLVPSLAQHDFRFSASITTHQLCELIGLLENLSFPNGVSWNCNPNKDLYLELYI